MPTAPTIEACYDFYPIETAIEALATTAQQGIEWLTGFDAAQLQKARPRIECLLEPGTPFGSPPHYLYTAQDGQRRVNGWVGQLRTTIITEVQPGETEQTGAQASYALHMQYRAFVLNLLATLDQQLGDNPTALPYHQIFRVWETGNSPKITPQEGVYTSQLNHNVGYNIRESAFPGGLIS